MIIDPPRALYNLATLQRSLINLSVRENQYIHSLINLSRKKKEKKEKKITQLFVLSSFHPSHDLVLTLKIKKGRRETRGKKYIYITLRPIKIQWHCRMISQTLNRCARSYRNSRDVTRIPNKNFHRMQSAYTSRSRGCGILRAEEEADA